MAAERERDLRSRRGGYPLERKIIILKEDGVSFPSDFSDLGYIPFADGEISAKAMHIMQELIRFKLLIIKAAE